MAVEDFRQHRQIFHPPRVIVQLRGLTTLTTPVILDSQQLRQQLLTTSLGHTFQIALQKRPSTFLPGQFEGVAHLIQQFGGTIRAA
ncbi:MAG UNVERIFIED_CONTAM: hypothetical protein LVR18_31300 [Planctomycetaceae bacterium]